MFRYYLSGLLIFRTAMAGTRKVLPLLSLRFSLEHYMLAFIDFLKLVEDLAFMFIHRSVSVMTVGNDQMLVLMWFYST